MSIVFGTSVSTFSAFFTYVSQVTLLAYDDADVLVDTATSLFGANFVSAGTVGASPNELLQLDFAGGMRRIELIGDPGGLSFVLDDASFEPVSPAGCPSLRRCCWLLPRSGWPPVRAAVAACASDPSAPTVRPAATLDAPGFVQAASPTTSGGR